MVALPNHKYIEMYDDLDMSIDIVVRVELDMCKDMLLAIISCNSIKKEPHIDMAIPICHRICYGHVLGHIQTHTT